MCQGGGGAIVATARPVHSAPGQPVLDQRHEERKGTVKTLFTLVDEDHFPPKFQRIWTLFFGTW